MRSTPSLGRSSVRPQPTESSLGRKPALPLGHGVAMKQRRSKSRSSRTLAHRGIWCSAEINGRTRLTHVSHRPRLEAAADGYLTVLAGRRDHSVSDWRQYRLVVGGFPDHSNRHSWSLGLSQYGFLNFTLKWTWRYRTNSSTSAAFIII